MLRFLTALAVLGAVLFGYDRWIVGREQAAEKPFSTPTAQDAEAPSAEPELSAPPAPVPEPTAPLLTSAQEAAGDADPAAAAVLSELEENPKEAVPAALRLLAANRIADRARAARQLEACVAQTPVEELPAVLGEDNAFLHSAEGRRVFEQVVAKTLAEPPATAVIAMSRLLEKCMQGRIEKTDLEAHAAVDEAYAAYRPLLLRTVLNPADLTRARSHKVESGDSLERIAGLFRQQGLKVEAGTLAVFNRITDPRRLQAGQVLKIPLDPIRTLVEKRSFLLAVYVGDVIFRLYWVAHGKDDCTPETTFTVGAKKEHPDWYADGRVIPYGHPENVLGDYFIKFMHPSFTGFGIHGTSEPDSIGTMASAGCIRLNDDDIADYFWLVPGGSTVEIRAST